jgi:hypothetical protein
MALKGSAQMKHLIASLTIGACLLLSAGVVFATDAHKISGIKVTTGQNGTGSTLAIAACGGAGSAQPSPPGQANNPLNNSPFPTAGNPSPTPNYAGQGKGNYGEGTGSVPNPHANSQYDNACFQQMP